MVPIKAKCIKFIRIIISKFPPDVTKTINNYSMLHILIIYIY